MDRDEFQKLRRDALGRLALVLSLGFLAATPAAAQALSVGAALPRLEADTLADTKVALPDAAAGTPAVVVFSFSRGAGDKAEVWSTALRKRFAGGGPSVWSAASLQGAPRFIRGMIRGGMRKQTPKDAHGRALCLYTDDKLWRQRLGVADDEVPVVVGLDGSGTIRWLHRGGHDPTREQELATVLVSPPG